MDLSNYVLVGRYDLPEPTRTSGEPTGNLLAQEASAVTYNWDTNTLFITGDGGTSITQVSLTGELIDTMTLAAGTSPQGTTFWDTESITYVGNGQFVLGEERYRQVSLFTYAAGTTLTRAGVQTVDLGTDIGNIGLEGLTYDPLTGGFVMVKESGPTSIFQTTIDFAAGTASNGSSTTVNSTNLFDPALAGLSDFSEVYALSSNAGFVGTSEEGNLLILSQETGRIIEVSRDGTILSTLNLPTPTTTSGISLQAMTVEGMTMGPDGTLYIVNEEGGGDFDHPQLWVFKPSAAVNEAPTAIALTGATTALLENTSTLTRLKVADIALTDDGIGTNNFTVTGADAAHFEADSTGLYIKAGTVLDYESKSSYTVTVNVDDPTLGSSPDASTSYALSLTNVVNESGAGTHLIISEVAAWSSGNSPLLADWFEVTNTGSEAVDITGWKVDDSSAAFGSALALNGITSIAAGESVIFIETASAATVDAFKTLWFGTTVPAGLQIGTYTGSGIGLSTSGDAVNLFNTAGVIQASVTFAGSDALAPYQTFDNTAGINAGAISTLSVSGVNGAFVAAGDANEVGSPGTAGGVAAPVNQAPTAIALSSEVTQLPEGTDTAARIKVANVLVTDDGLGSNVLSLTGADADSFEVDSTGLYLKAGLVLDYDAKSSYAVTVTVDDPTVGATPDASVGFNFTLTEVAAAPSLKITEVAPWSSGNSPVGADWFEVTNTGTSAVDLTGWKVDDSSNTYANAVALSGVTSIAAGESVIFIEASSSATVDLFKSLWFANNVPAGLQIGTYSGAGIGLSTGGDALNLFDAAGVVQASVSFGAADASAPWQTFDNAAGIDGGAITTFAADGVNGAFTIGTATMGAEIGSPGRVASPAGTNAAPTALALANQTTALAENTATGTNLKVADIVVTDDGIGSNLLSLSGADAALFAVDNTGLYLKAGTVLDYETKAQYNVTVNVDDAAVGGSPDASTSYTLNLTDVPFEGPPALIISEVSPWSSGSNTAFRADWFEVTNVSDSVIDLTGWKFDDDSGSFASAVALSGITSIAAGESVVFIESSTPDATRAAFLNAWFGSNAPTDLRIGTYTGSGIGLSTTSDAVNLFNAAGQIQARVTFGASPSGPSFGTFDNAAGLNNTAISQLSVVGTNAAFSAVNPLSGTTNIGSPGQIAPVNHAPIAAGEVLASSSEDGGARTISFASLLANDLSGPANEAYQTLTIISVSNAVGGTAVIDGTDVIFTPAANYSGPASFDYTVQDNGTTGGADAFLTATATASFTIDAVNDAPALTGTAAALADGTEDTAYTLQAAELLAGFTDAEGDALSLGTVSVSNGSVTDNLDGTYTIAPAANANGAQVVSYEVLDGNGGATAATLGLTLQAVNDAPSAITLSSTVLAENTRNGTIVGTLSTSDVDNASGFTYALLDNAGGAFSLNAVTRQIFVSNGNLLDYELATGKTIAVRTTDASGASFEQQITITLTNVVENQTYTGNFLANTFTAPSEDNWTVDARGGADTITTAGGADVIYGGGGHDVIATGAGNDTIVFTGNGGGFDAVDGGIGTDTILANAANTTIGLAAISGIEAISSGGLANVRVLGTSAADSFDFSGTTLSGIVSIGGGAGNDQIVGSSAADRIIGGAGADVLTGGDGADHFAYAVITESGIGAKADHILDFVAGVDTLDLSGIDAVGDTAGNQTFTFIGADDFTGVGQVRVGMSGGQVVVQANTAGNLAADFSIVLDSNPVLTMGDFIL